MEKEMAQVYENEIHDEERGFYGLVDAVVRNCKIDGPSDGESAFKECKNIVVLSGMLFPD